MNCFSTARYLSLMGSTLHLTLHRYTILCCCKWMIVIFTLTISGHVTDAAYTFVSKYRKANIVGSRRPNVCKKIASGYG